MAFRLEKILNLRKQEEESIKQELLNVRIKVKNLEEEIEQVEVSKEDVEKQLRTGSQNGAQLGFLIYLINMYNGYLNTLKAKLETLRNEEEKIFKKYMEKRTERKSLEKLETRFKEMENFEVDRKNRLTIDEIALQKYFRMEKRKEN